MRWLLALTVLSLAGCPADPPRTDAGGGGMDVGPVDAPIPPGTDAPIPPGTDAPGACVPRVEICGNFMDENCDGRETPCGDTDRDGIEACRVGEAPPACDCDDARNDVYPPFGVGVPGGSELCDGRDNDCNGRIDEAAACCTACMALGAGVNRGDVCTEAGTCDCSTEPGDGVCPVGETCCISGCVDTRTDVNNCGLCGAMCTDQSDRCAPDAAGMGECRCGTAAPCNKAVDCNAGSCG